MTEQRLPSWRPGATRDAILGYLDTIDDVPTHARVAYLDNDGTMWMERPSYVQLHFFVAELQRRAKDDPALAQRPEFDAVLRNDQAAIGEVGLERVALALAGLFDGFTPSEFTAAVGTFCDHYRNPTTGGSIESVVYQPMLELIAELRAHDFTVGIVTGGGTEFVRNVAGRLYDVGPELVVGTLIGYDFERDQSGQPTLKRTVKVMGNANEGAAKVAHIQSQIGRRPIFAAGNSGGDREMLEWACSGDHPGLAVLINHDDADREFAYESKAVSFTESESITDVGAQLGWVIVSMQRDWETVFAVADVK